MRRSVHNLGLFLCVACVACQMAEQPATELATAEPVSEPVVREESIAATDGISLVYDVRGTGETALVFVHCWACERSFWRGQVDHFADRFRVVAIDLPGHGASGAEREHWSIADLGADVVAVVEQEGLERVVLIGHSMGGPVSLHAAALMPHRVLGIVCADTLHNVEHSFPVEQMERIVQRFEEDFVGTMTGFARGAFAEGSDPELVTWVAEKAGGANPEVAIALFKDFPNLELETALAAVTVPVRGINKAPQNEQDPVTEIGINQQYGDFDAVLMEGVGHFLILEQPDAFNQLLEQTLAEILSPETARH